MATKAERYPVLWAEFTKLQSEREAILAQTADLKQQRESLLQQVDKLRAKERTLVEQIQAIERPRLSEIDQQLSGLARAMGGESLNS